LKNLISIITHTDTHEATSPGSRGHSTITGDPVGRSVCIHQRCNSWSENKTRMAGSTSLSSLSFRVHIDSSLCLSPSLSCGGPRFQRAPNEVFIIFHILFPNESHFLKFGVILIVLEKRDDRAGATGAETMRRVAN
jgi:hypothetical protein